ncbi:MAG: WD40 repeat domain-containing protein, partial [Candidatus Acidiferrales bacterium]
AGLPADPSRAESREASAEAGELWADLEVAPAAAVTQLSFSTDGKRLLSVFEDARAVLWDLEKRQELQRFSPAPVGEGEQPTEISAMILSPDGRRVLQTWVRGSPETGQQAEMSLLEVGGKILWRRAGLGVDFAPDAAAVLALVPPYRIAALYRAENAAALRVFEPPEGVERLLAVRLNPAGTRLAGVTSSRLGQGLVVWDAATARLLRSRR